MEGIERGEDGSVKYGNPDLLIKEIVQAYRDWLNNNIDGNYIEYIKKRIIQG